MILDCEFIQLDNIIKRTARRFAPKIRGMEYEDLYQELWLDAIQKDYSSLPLANTSIKNKAIDILKKEYKHYYDRELSEDDEVNDIFLKEETLDNYLYYVYEFDSYAKADLLSVIDKLDEQCRKYLVCKVYLDCNFECLEDEFNKIVSSLSKEEKDELLGRDESKRTGLGIDTLISKYVLGYKSKNYIYSFKKRLQTQLETALA